MTPLISIIIPTYNRKSSLMRSLESLQKQKNALMEIIVVDNAHEKSIHNEIKKFNHTATYPVIYISEQKLGLHFARHKGAITAKTEILIFTDDDATFSPDWVKSYIDAFFKYPKMVAAGGPVRPKWESNPPIWLKEFMGESKIFTPFSLMDSYKKFNLDKKGYFFGVNMAVRKKTLFEVGGFNPELIGNTYVGDGEFGLNKKLWQKKLLIGYVPQAIIFHQIPNDRMTLDYLLKRMVNEGASNAYSLFHSGIPNYFVLILKIIALALKNIKLFAAALFYKGKTDSNSLNIQLEAYRIYGQIIYMLRLLTDQNFRSLVLQKDWLKE
mgnify:CR=1 FL=1